MATASSAQREPSMEEILASIRRIIEDSDTGRKQPGEADELHQDLEPASAAEPALDVDASRAERRAGPEAGKTITLADVKAQLTAVEPPVARFETPVRADPDSPRAPTLAMPAPATLAEVSARIATEPLAMAATARIPETTDAIVADWRREIAAIGEQAKVTTGVEQGKAEMWRAESNVEIEDELTAEPAVEQAPARSGSIHQGEAPLSRPAILSEHTGRQVAAAFGELSDAFASRSKKTFDEMAEEMLRPMLQDWLDNNLPTLVERLVREEIERVARGAQ